VIGAPAIIASRSAEAAFAKFQLGNPTDITGHPFPGEPGNLVGHANTPATSLSPAWPGSFANTASDIPTYVAANGNFVNGTAGSPRVYKFLDFDAGPQPSDGNGPANTLTADGTYGGPSLSYVTFVGCRFQANATGNGAAVNVVMRGSTNVVFSYCTFCPRTAVAPSIPNPAWPSSAAGLGWNLNNVIGSGGGGTKYIPFATYQMHCIGPNDGCQYGFYVGSGPLTLDHCDIWGMAAPLNIQGGSINAMTFTDNWIHDYQDCITVALGQHDGFHTDGIGFPSTGVAPNGGQITIQHNTLATLGNVSSLMWQITPRSNQGRQKGFWDSTTLWDPGSPGVSVIDRHDGNLYYNNTGMPLSGGLSPSLSTQWTLVGPGYFSDILAVNNFLSGQNYLIDPGSNMPMCRNLVYTDNILSWILPPYFGPVYASPANGNMGGQFTSSSLGNFWIRNKIVGGPHDGMFAYPNGGFGSIDWHN
jgi:hypothetical protein